MVLGPVYQRQSQVPVNPLRLGGALAPASTTMRYYRLWIYTCNALLLVSVVGFSVAAARVLVLDPRRHLVPGLALTQPGFLCAYAALLFQSGFLQLVGCLGAHRLNERLLNLYWLLLLALLVGDLVLGVFWLFRFDRILAELRPFLKSSLALKYGVDSQFTSLWDGLQAQTKCCGLHGYQDFYQYNSSVTGEGGVLPGSCCREARGGLVVAALHRSFHHTPVTTAPTTAATPPPLPPHQPHQPRCPPDSLPHQQPCLPHIHAWLTQTAHILFVLGYCVIAFIKLSFLGILRYEIKEMIQKIKLVQESGSTPPSNRPDLVEKLTVKQNNGAILAQQPNNIGKMVEGESPARGRHLTTLITQDAGTDSDTNSHCALILCEEGVKPAQENTNGNNNNYEMNERRLT